MAEHWQTLRIQPGSPDPVEQEGAAGAARPRARQYQEGLRGTALPNRLDIWHGLKTSHWDEYEEEFQLGDLVYCSF